MERYIIITTENKPYETNWYNKTCFIKDIGMLVIDTFFVKYTSDGVNWQELKEGQV